MSAHIIDGKAIAAALREEAGVRAHRLRANGIMPGLAVVIVGEDAASKIYVRNKASACEQVGMHSEVHALPEDTTQAELIAFVQRLNHRRSSSRSCSASITIRPSTASWCSCRFRDSSRRVP
jgi:methylenetetrahydrofolate dehydrogenase (NADP+) / methenyltetrahydrofolate cyclohydrolase